MAYKTEYLIEKFQGILKNKSTTFVRRIFDGYCKSKNYSQWTWRGACPPVWYYTEYDCKRRLRTICTLHDGMHELRIALRKKAGYYFIIEFDRRRIFECDPDVLVLEKEKIAMVCERYKELFNLLFEQHEKKEEKI